MNDKVTLEGEFEVKGENSSEKIEISPALERLGQTADDAENLEKKQQEKQGESERAKKEKFAREIANGALSGLDEILDMFLQVNTGLTKEERADFCKDFAPLLVRMGVTDYRGFLDGYGCYVMAAVAVFKIGFKVTRNIQAQMLEKLQQEPQPETVSEIQQEAGSYQQDFTGQGR